MNEKSDKAWPTAIRLHQKSRVLEISFSDGLTFKLPCEYLRAFSPAAEVKAAKVPVHGKAAVNITHIEPQGEYALRLFFDDGHDTGIYSWDSLHRLGLEYERNWTTYLKRLEEHHLDRGEAPATTTPDERTIKLLYFMQLANIAERDEETAMLPETVHTVASLLAWLRERGRTWNDGFSDERVQVTVNKQFAEPTTPLAPGDEVAIVPRARD